MGFTGLPARRDGAATACMPQRLIRPEHIGHFVPGSDGLQGAPGWMGGAARAREDHAGGGPREWRRHPRHPQVVSPLKRFRVEGSSLGL